MFFYYDSNGTPTSFSNNGVMYYYVKNLQGDIVKITKQDGTVVASYVYDVSGKLLSVKDSANDEVANSDAFHIANINPYRYRGYLYDTETGLYYLQTRYYDPIIGRFINADDLHNVLNYNNVLATNTFAFCANNPVNNVDPSGEFWFTAVYELLTYLMRSAFGLNVIYTAVSVITSINNFNYNQQFKFSSYIHGQGDDNEAKLKIGFYTSDYAGCGWIATYNALVALGNPDRITPANIISYFELWGCIVSGAFGIMPDAVADYFRFLKYTGVDEYYRPNNMDSIIKKYRVTVLFYAHSSGCHFIMVEYNKYKESFFCYNLYDESTHYEAFESIDTFFKRKNYHILHITGVK